MYKTLGLFRKLTFLTTYPENFHINFAFDAFQEESH